MGTGYPAADKCNQAKRMTAFITLPTTAVYKKSSGGQRAKLFCFSLFLAAFCVTVSCYQIWSFIRTNELRTEVNILRDQVENMRKRMGLELFDDLEEFDNVYAPHTEDSYIDEEEDGLPENRVFSDDLSDFDEDLEDEEYDEVYDLESELKSHLNDDELDRGSGDHIDDDEDDNDRIPHRNQRKPRDVNTPVDGVPIIEESYALRRNRTNTKTDERIAKVLLKKNSSPQMHYDWTFKSEEESARNTDVNSQKHRQPTRRHMKKFLEHRGAPTMYVTRTASDAIKDNGQPQNHIRHNNHQHHQQQLSPHQIPNMDHQQKHRRIFQQDGGYIETKSGSENIPLLPSVVQVRASRAMVTNEDPSKAFRQIITKAEYARLKALRQISPSMPAQIVEAKAHPELVAYPPSSRRRLVRKSGGTGGSGSKVSRQVASRPRLIAVQFNGDTSRYATGRHEHYHGNGLVQHSGGVFLDWAAANWVNSMGLDKHFSMEHGVLTVREPGLYYIYAQIYYKDEHDTNGFVIEHNDNSIMQCSTMTHSTHRVSKTNTCHTSAVAFLRADDQIKVVNLGNHRLAIFEAAKSFFGLIKLSGIPTQHSQRLQQMPQTDSPTMNPNLF